MKKFSFSNFFCLKLNFNLKKFPHSRNWIIRYWSARVTSKSLLEYGKYTRNGIQKTFSTFIHSSVESSCNKGESRTFRRRWVCWVVNRRLKKVQHAKNSKLNSVRRFHQTPSFRFEKWKLNSVSSNDEISIVIFFESSGLWLNWFLKWNLKFGSEKSRDEMKSWKLTKTCWISLPLNELENFSFQWEKE